MKFNYLFLRVALLTLLLIGLAACEDDDDDGDEDIVVIEPTDRPTAVSEQEPTAASVELAIEEVVPGEWYRPVTGTTWQWQLSGDLNLSYNVDMYDIDLFDTPAETIQALKNKGIAVVCYFSAGSYEEWREDADQFEAAVLGEPLEGWPGERWLDHRSPNVRAIMQSRLDLARNKGCDGVEPDNMTGYNNDTSFDMTSSDQIDYNRFLADEAHARGLGIGLKNDLEQITELVDYFDFAVNEECFQYDECETLQPFIDQGKAVFNAEYEDAILNNPDPICRQAERLRFSTLILAWDLDDTIRISCQNEG